MAGYDTIAQKSFGLIIKESYDLNRRSIKILLLFMVLRVGAS